MAVGAELASIPDKGRFNGDISHGIIYQALTGRRQDPTPQNKATIHTSTLIDMGYIFCVRA